MLRPDRVALDREARADGVRQAGGGDVVYLGVGRQQGGGIVARADMEAASET